MKRIAVLIATVLALSPLFELYADPGPGRPLFRRLSPAAPTQSKTPQLPGPKQDAAKDDRAVKPAENVTSEATSGAEVDVAEVLRRGDRVTRSGAGPMSVPDRLIGDAMAPPPDDSHKWFLSILVDDGKESQSLLYDLRHSQHLRAWVDLDEPRQSWAHATIYRYGDESQDWRWKNLKISRLPVMILQPPAKLLDERDPKSWGWGDPKIVVWQWDGYDSTNPARAQLRSDAVRKALTAYVASIQAKRFDRRLAGPQSGAPPPTPGAKQASTPGSKQEGQVAAPSIPVVPSVPSSNPVFPADPLIPSAPIVSSGGASLVLTGLSLLAGGSGTTNLLLLTIGVLSAIRTWKTVRGKAKLLDDASFAALTDGLKAIAGQAKQT